MKDQNLINAIAILSGSIDPLTRAKREDAISAVVEKMLELIKKLK